MLVPATTLSKCSFEETNLAHEENEEPTRMNMTCFFMGVRLINLQNDQHRLISESAIFSQKLTEMNAKLKIKLNDSLDRIGGNLQIIHDRLSNLNSRVNREFQHITGVRDRIRKTKDHAEYPQEELKFYFTDPQEHGSGLAVEEFYTLYQSHRNLIFTSFLNFFSRYPKIKQKAKAYRQLDINALTVPLPVVLFLTTRIYESPQPSFEEVENILHGLDKHCTFINQQNQAYLGQFAKVNEIFATIKSSISAEWRTGNPKEPLKKFLECWALQHEEYEKASNNQESEESCAQSMNKKATTLTKFLKICIRDITRFTELIDQDLKHKSHNFI